MPRCSHEGTMACVVRDQELQAWPCLTGFWPDVMEKDLKHTEGEKRIVAVGADVHRPIRMTVRILIWQDYKHGYAPIYTARTISRFATIRSPFHKSSCRNVPLQLYRYRVAWWPSSRVVTYSDPQSRANWMSLCPPQRKCGANKTRILLVLLSWEFPQPTTQERQLSLYCLAHPLCSFNHFTLHQTLGIQPYQIR